MTASLPLDAFDEAASVFTGADVAAHAGFIVSDDGGSGGGPFFDEDVWDFTTVAGLPVQMPSSLRRLDFTGITNGRWRLVAKELMFAFLVPHHHAVAVLPRALRTPLHLRTCHGRLSELVSWMTWLTDEGVDSLTQVRNHHCQGYLAHRRHVRDDEEQVVGQRSPATRRAAAQTVIDLINYRELFTADRVDANLRPWSGASASAIAEMPNGRDHNTTPPVKPEVLGPMLTAACYLVDTLGVHVAEMSGRTRAATRARPTLPAPTRLPTDAFTAVIDHHLHHRAPLPLLAEPDVRRRLTRGWDPADPLLRVSLASLANQAGVRQFHPRWLPALRARLEDTLALVGTAKPWVRDADPVEPASGGDPVPWTLPLHGTEGTALAGIVRTATIIVIAAASGMRSSELMELTVNSRRPPEQLRPGGVRYRLASKVIKGQPLGGTDEEWVVIEPVHRAAELAEQLLDDPKPDTPLFGRFAFPVRYKWFRHWVNGPAGQRLGLAPIPEAPVSLRMLRRTLAIELAYRPGGVLATKIHLKHVSVATTEGYASRPGGAQAQLLTEVNKHEADRNLQLLWEEYRNYTHGIQPAGPGARDLLRYFAHLDAELTPQQAAAPTVQRSNREVLNLLSKRADTLHLGTANYCWFTDPARALCLRLAGTPNADPGLSTRYESRCSLSGGS